VVFTTSGVIDGVCYGYVFWKRRMDAFITGIWHLISFYVIMVFGLVFCYGRILVVVRHQAKVMAGHSAPGSTSTTTQAMSKPVQTNVIKTMVMVCLFFIISYTPMQVYYFQVNLGVNLPLSGSVFYVLMSFAFIYICTNPFIYAIKFEPVKRVLLNLIVCKESSEHASENGTTTGARRHTTTHQ